VEQNFSEAIFVIQIFTFHNSRKVG